ncbi:hypothetical protein SERLA73DRAFT_153873 [Serpula lacrymans var. lacrymans S7.3]|uniref:Uncharacterized protein n=1 Tax=Serpula lacrymans var. lacrymans (strain S7.3) TaxID=936435 RepID=F8Q2U0_SERL3|nr:hypothetical protein SERLA73DRAFT_153873 [Serpula lacrymans var. lacrymans S7.3]
MAPSVKGSRALASASWRRVDSLTSGPPPDNRSDQGFLRIPFIYFSNTIIATLTSQLAELQNNPPVATPSVEKKFNKKVEVVADPGAFEGDRVRFAEWWFKLQIWVKANWDVFADNFEVSTAVLSRLKGPVAG